MAYTKLFNSIVTSTIWMEDDRTRIVWITMLACADKNGEVQASIPGLARIAGVPVEDCRAAIGRFLSPDLDSRTKDDQGRRIEEIDGGWSLLNFRKYREMASKEESQANETARKARYREGLKRNGKASGCPAVVPFVPSLSTVNPHIAEADADTDTKADTKAFTKATATPTPPLRPLISGEANPRTWGKIHGDHVTGFCDWVCLPEFVFSEFVRKSPGADYVRQWAAGVRAAHEGQVIGDNLKFWRVRWSETHPEVAAKRKDEPFSIAKALEIEAQRKAERMAKGASL